MIYPVVLHKEKNSERLPTRDRLKKCLPQKLRTVFRDIGSAPWWRWLDLPVRPLATVIVAVVFAMSLAVAVPKDEVALLGFLSVISVLWMSSSLSLLDIVGEREVFDHEHHLFLKVRAYLGAKLTSNLILAALQTVVFFATLEIMRQCLLGEISWDAAEKKLPTSLMSGRLLVLMSIPHAAKIDAIPTDPASVVSCLMATGLNARVATRQITTDTGSVGIASNSPVRGISRPLAPRWDWRFQRSPSTKHQESPTFRVRFGLCQRCSELGTHCFGFADAAKREEMARKISSPEDLFAEIKDNIPTSHHNPSAFWPNRLAAALSHVTVSRHGDIVLRGMNVPDDKPVDRAVVAPWTRNASGFLVAQFVALVLVTALVLHLQTRGRRTFVRMKTVAQTVRPLRVES